MRVTSSTTARLLGSNTLPPSYNSTHNPSSSGDLALASTTGTTKRKKVRMVSFGNQTLPLQVAPAAHSPVHPNPIPCWAKVVQPFDQTPEPPPTAVEDPEVVHPAPESATPPKTEPDARMPSADTSDQACSLLAGASKKRRCALCTKPLDQQCTRICSSCDLGPAGTCPGGAYTPPHLRTGASRGNSTLRVANLDREQEVREAEAELRRVLRTHCRAHVRRVNIPVCRETGNGRGFAFVEFSDPQAAHEAVEGAAAHPWRLGYMVLELEVA
eukprot:TRINITY_DN36484_c0_g1_i1.p1 TRINITY_DN36484_c0_g1~~TRINITY_DN36484_c0_g1_i1.p1  ORF type:complete len:271 (-),score=26.24 TRINITY_DN36484_c0_g1_i1:411-1223(-)